MWHFNQKTQARGEETEYLHVVAQFMRLFIYESSG